MIAAINGPAAGPVWGSSPSILRTPGSVVERWAGISNEP
jgi:hypothetical protein